MHEFGLSAGGPKDALTARSAAERTERILLVDDDPDVRRFIEASLSALGYRDIQEAADGKEALERAIALRPDVVITNITMPELNGFELTRELRRDPRTRSAIVVILTARAAPADIVRGLSVGADEYLVKPFEPLDLLARVEGRLVRRQQFRDGTTDAQAPG